jgi:hypothetical protein
MVSRPGFEPTTSRIHIYRVNAKLTFSVIITENPRSFQVVLAYFPEEGLCYLHSVCLSPWTKLYETWCAYHATSAHLNGLLHKSLQSLWVRLCVYLLEFQGNGSVKCITPFGTRQRLSKYIPAATNTCNNSISIQEQKQTTKNKREHDTQNTSHVRIRGTHVTTAE